MLEYPLNSSQQKAVDYTDGPLLIVAGAGTGKTTVVTQKISQLIRSKKAKPEEILALTFTDKAAGEMQDRVDELLDLGYIDLQISTFHTFCQKIIEDFGMDIGLPNHFRLLTETDAWLLSRENLDKLNLDYYRPMGNPSSQIHTLLQHFSKCKDELISPGEYLDYAENLKLDTDEASTDEKNRLTEIANAYHAYNNLLLENNSLDFGDLIYYSVKLLTKRIDIKNRLQKRFKYILVDEFQDVNYAQYELVRLLSEKSQLTVVGDDDQSIYAFRGASVSNILRFKEDYPNAQEIVLNENYRSGQKILDTAYKSIQNNNPDRLEIKLNIDKRLKASTPNLKSKVINLHCHALDDEVTLTIQEIAKLKSENPNASWDDFAILVRANTHAEPFIHALESAQIPYEFLASAGLYRQPVVLDCFNFLKLLDNYHEHTGVYRLLKLPHLKFKESDLQKITQSAKKKSISYYEALKRASEFWLSKEGIDTCNKLTNLLHDGMKQSRTEKPTIVLYNFLENSGYLEYLLREEEKGNQIVIRQIYQLKQFLDFIRAYETTIPDSSAQRFVEHYNHILESGDKGKLFQPQDTPDSVNILTVHASKGLEFKYVFIINLVEERFPTRRRSQGIEIPLDLVREQLPEGDFHYQEERRLFYVAVTRAKERLYLVSSEDYGGTRKKKMSRFLTELEYGNEGKSPHPAKGGLGGVNSAMIKPPSISPLGSGKGMAFTPPKAFSFSQIRSYQKCPYQYKLMHILKIPSKGSASFSFGSTMHNTLQAFYEKVKDLNSAQQGSLFDLPQTNPDTTKTESKNSLIKVPSLEELYEMYDSAWIPDWFKTKKQREEYYQKGKEIFKLFFQSQGEVGWTIPVTLEGWFKIKVGDYLVHGRIDRIDQHPDGSLEIIDYKTGKSKEKLTAEDKEQLLIYQIAAETLPEYRNIGPVGKLTFFYLNDNLQSSFVGNDKGMEKLKEKLIGTIKKIHEGSFIATPNQMVCKYCDFRDICEYRES